MKYIVTSTKSVTQAAIDLENAVKKHKFGVLHTLNLRQTRYQPHARGQAIACQFFCIILVDGFCCSIAQVNVSRTNA